jgi:Arc/MetJ-type ribon-helix-helix transcriptional regulator|tara:strand:- start:119 stop:355 length:237 start_codon:yes stop_codon:yes gene_type:complete
MSTSRVSVTLDEDQLAAIRSLVESGAAPSVSGFLREAAATALDDAAGWRALLDDALGATGGALTDAERAWADTILSTP